MALPEVSPPYYADVQEWVHSIELLCDLYGIPNVQRLQCALHSTEEELSTELCDVSGEVRERVGPVFRDQFTEGFLVVFDRD